MSIDLRSVTAMTVDSFRTALRQSDSLTFIRDIMLIDDTLPADLYERLTAAIVDEKAEHVVRQPTIIEAIMSMHTPSTTSPSIETRIDRFIWWLDTIKRLGLEESVDTASYLAQIENTYRAIYDVSKPLSDRGFHTIAGQMIVNNLHSRCVTPGSLPEIGGLFTQILTEGMASVTLANRWKLIPWVFKQATTRDAEYQFVVSSAVVDFMTSSLSPRELVDWLRAAIDAGQSLLTAAVRTALDAVGELAPIDLLLMYSTGRTVNLVELEAELKTHLKKLSDGDTARLISEMLVSAPPAAFQLVWAKLPTSQRIQLLTTIAIVGAYALSIDGGCYQSEDRQARFTDPRFRRPYRVFNALCAIEDLLPEFSQIDDPADAEPLLRSLFRLRKFHLLAKFARFVGFQPIIVRMAEESIEVSDDGSAEWRPSVFGWRRGVDGEDAPTLPEFMKICHPKTTSPLLADSRPMNDSTHPIPDLPSAVKVPIDQIPLRFHPSTQMGFDSSTFCMVRQYLYFPARHRQALDQRWWEWPPKELAIAPWGRLMSVLAEP